MREIYETMKPVFDHSKKYRYTWPGQPPKVLAGKEMAELCAGCDPSVLDIHEEVDAKKNNLPGGEK